MGTGRWRGRWVTRAAAAALTAACAAFGGSAAHAGVGPTIELAHPNGGVLALTDAEVLYLRYPPLFLKSVSDGSETPASVLPDGTVVGAATVAASPNARFVAFTVIGQPGRFFRDLTAGVTQPLQITGMPNLGTVIAVSDDGATLLMTAPDPGTAGDGVWLLDRTTDSATEIADDGYPAAMGPSGDTVAWRDSQGQIVVYDVASRVATIVHQNLSGTLFGVGGPADRFVVWNDCTKPCTTQVRVLLYDRLSGELSVVDHGGFDPQISPNGRYIAWDTRQRWQAAGDVELLDRTTGMIRRANIGHSGYPTPGWLAGPISDSGAVPFWAYHPGEIQAHVHWTDQTPPPAPGVRASVRTASRMRADGGIPFRVVVQDHGPVCVNRITRIAAGDHRTVTQRSSRTTVIVRSGVPTDIRVDAVDCEGDASPVVTHPVTAWLRQEDARALSFGRAWSHLASAGALGGRVAVTHTDGSRFAWTPPSEAQRLALVAPVGPHRGWLTIRQGRYELGTIDLHASRPATRTIELLPPTNRKHPLVFYAHVRDTRSSVAIDAVLATSDRR